MSCVCNVPCLPVLVFELAVCIWGHFSWTLCSKFTSHFVESCLIFLTAPLLFTWNVKPYFSEGVVSYLLCLPSCRTSYPGIFCDFYLLEMACLNEKDFLEWLCFLYALGTVRGSRKGLPIILKRNDWLDCGEFVFQTKWYAAAIKWQHNKPLTVLSAYHNPGDGLWSQASHLSETEKQRWYIIDYSVPLHSCRVQHDNGRSRLFRPETREICNWEALAQMVAPSALLSHWPCDVNSFIMWNCNNGGQPDQLLFRLALIRQLIVGREIKRRCRSDFVTKNKQGISGILDDMRLREVGKHLPVRTTRRQCSIRKQEARTNMMCSHCMVPLCVHPCFKKFHRK
jgi:hypothetical protein